MNNEVAKFGDRREMWGQTNVGTDGTFPNLFSLA